MKRLLIAILLSQHIVFAGLNEGIAFIELTLQRITQKNRSQFPGLLDGTHNPDPNYQQAVRNYATMENSDAAKAEQRQTIKKRFWWIFGCGTCMR